MSKSTCFCNKSTNHHSPCLSNIAALVGMTTNLNEMEICSALALQHPPTHSCDPWPCVQDELWLVKLKTQQWRGHTEGNWASWCQNVPWSETRFLAKGTGWSQSLAKYLAQCQQTYSDALPLGWLLFPSLWLGKKQGLGKRRNVGVRRDRIGPRNSGLAVMQQLVF